MQQRFQPTNQQSNQQRQQPQTSSHTSQQPLIQAQDNSFQNAQPSTQATPNQLKQAFTSFLRHFQNSPEPQLNWQKHEDKNSLSEFQELIESRFNEIKRSSPIYKYYAKIGFQVFVYLLNILELIFTLTYNSYNRIEDGAYLFCYNFSIIMCLLLHCGAWMYTYKFKKVIKQIYLIEFAFYLYYMIMGALSYLKIAPLIYYFNREEQIRQFSFSEIDKYLQLSVEDKFRNPCRLFKDRTKPVNMFRDLIFHRVALLSMMITMIIQTIPQLFIQGFYNTKKELWDGFNVFSYLLLLSNLIYYLCFELQFIVFTTTYRSMKTELQFKLKKIKLKFIQETKQLLKSNQKYMAFVQSFYFHIDPCRFSPYQKKRCMIQIIKSLIKQKKCKNIQFHYIDQYEDVTLQYLANCFKLINLENRISLLYHDRNRLKFLRDTFKNIEKLFFEHQNNNLDNLWESEKFNPNAEEEKVKGIQFIENPKITAGWQAVYQNQSIKNNYLQLSKQFEEFIALSQHNPSGPVQNREAIRLYIDYENNFMNLIPQGQSSETPQTIIEEAKNEINNITKKDIFGQSVRNIQILMTLFDYFDRLNKMNEYQFILQFLWSGLNGSFSIVSLFYLSNEIDMYIIALIILTSVNPLLQMISFAAFQKRVFRDFTPLRQLSQVFLFAIFNFFKIWDIVTICLFLTVERFREVVKREFSSVGYVKFKSYASKFQGSIATSVFQLENMPIVDTNIKEIKEIKKQPFYEAIMWRTNVEEALNKVPQFFVYVLSLSSNQFTGIWFISFIQQLKESIFAIKDILEIVIKDYFIPALILSTVSVDQFLQSMLYLSSISNQMLLEYPKSFQIMSKVKQQYLKEKFTFKINLKTLDFSNYVGKKQEKLLAQFRFVLASITTILEIDQAQRLFCMGPGLNDLIRCLKVSPLYQLKLNYYLAEVDPTHISYINTFIKNSPKSLQFLQLQIESIIVHQMQISLERNPTLKAFSYSYYQIIPQYRQNAVRPLQSMNANAVRPEEESMNVNAQFLQLDRYNLEEFYFEISGNVILNNCHTLFQKFSQLKVFNASIFNSADTQTFQFSKNLTSTQLKTLEINFENIKLDFQQYTFKNLIKLKMILKRCEFNKQELKTLLQSLDNPLLVVYIEMSQCSELFTPLEQRDLVRSLERKKIDVFIKI